MEWTNLEVGLFKSQCGSYMVTEVGPKEPFQWRGYCINVGNIQGARGEPLLVALSKDLADCFGQCDQWHERIGKHVL